MACQIYRILWDGKAPIRQIGVHTSKVQKDECRQYNLFDNTPYEKLAKVNRTIDTIRSKYGEDAVMRANFIRQPVSHMSGGLHKERRTGITLGMDLNKEKVKEG